MEWELLPSPEELMPLTQSLITPELAGAFSIDLQKHPPSGPPQPQQQQQPQPQSQQQQQQQQQQLNSDLIPEEIGDGGSGKKARRSSQQQQQEDSEEAEADSGNSGGDEPSARTLKRPRLVWTPQLHKRFVDAVAQLGIKSAVPKTIMQLMNVEGLTRENVASHLQKYRLYLKRMQGNPSDGLGSAASDPLFASTPVPPGLASAAAHFLQGHHDVIPVPYAAAAAAAAATSHSYVAFDQHAAAAAAAAFGRRADESATLILHQRQQQQQQQQQQQGSPPRRVLTLFPTSSH